MSLAIHQYTKLNNKYMKDYGKTKEPSHRNIWDVNNLDGWRNESTYQFNKDFTENYNRNSDKGNVLEVDVKYFEKSQDFHSDLPVMPERIKIEKVIATLHDKKGMLCT